MLFWNQKGKNWLKKRMNTIFTHDVVSESPLVDVTVTHCNDGGYDHHRDARHSWAMDSMKEKETYLLKSTQKFVATVIVLSGLTEKFANTTKGEWRAGNGEQNISKWKASTSKRWVTWSILLFESIQVLEDASAVLVEGVIVDVRDLR